MKKKELKANGTTEKDGDDWMKEDCEIYRNFIIKKAVK